MEGFLPFFLVLFVYASIVLACHNWLKTNMEAIAKSARRRACGPIKYVRKKIRRRIRLRRILAVRPRRVCCSCQGGIALSDLFTSEEAFSMLTTPRCISRGTSPFPYEVYEDSENSEDFHSPADKGCQTDDVPEARPPHPVATAHLQLMQQLQHWIPSLHQPSPSAGCGSLLVSSSVKEEHSTPSTPNESRSARSSPEPASNQDTEDSFMVIDGDDL